ncbi:MAG TPA: hypothetical protein ENJ56_05710 [Anaerolineae bacterium]|nr:hypothetical protein [Anaerolineae bacterium]
MSKTDKNKSGRTTRTLVIAYISADNDLSPYAKQIVRRLRLGTRHNKDVTVIALVDQLGEGNTHLVIMSDGKRWTPRDMRQFADFELDMASPQVLGKFLRYARQKIASERTIVVMIGHGTGPVPQCEWNPADVAPSEARPLSVGGFPVTPQDHPMTPQDHPMTPQDHPMTPGDLSSQRTLSTVGLGMALQHATKNGKYPFDVLFMDQCFQGNLDVLYELRDTAKVFVASPNYAWLRASYMRYLKVFASAETPEQIASYLIVTYQETLTSQYPNAIFWVRGRDIAPIAHAVSALGLALQAVIKAGDPIEIRRIEWAIEHGNFADTGCVSGKFELGKGDELMGAASFAANLRLGFAAQDKHGVYKAATKLLQTLLVVHGSHRVGNPTVAPDTIWDFDDTITILAPRERDATNQRGGVWRASLYKPQD